MRREVLPARSWRLELAAIVVACSALLIACFGSHEAPTTLFTCEHPAYPGGSYFETCASNLEEAQEDAREHVPEVELVCTSTDVYCDRQHYP